VRAAAKDALWALDFFWVKSAKRVWLHVLLVSRACKAHARPSACARRREQSTPFMIRARARLVHCFSPMRIILRRPRSRTTSARRVRSQGRGAFRLLASCPGPKAAKPFG
jgi:hypothetical protein